MRREHLSAGIPPDRVVTVYLGVPIPDELPPAPPVGDVFRLLYVGRLCEDKGVRVAIRAMGELIQDKGVGNCALDIVGAGPDEYVSQLKQEMKLLGLSNNRVRFLGLLPHEQVERMRPTYHSFVFPSVWAEPFGLVLIEAMSAGLPVIGSPVGGSGEILVDEENSITFPPGDHAALAAGIKRLMSDEQLRTRLRQGGYHDALNRFQSSEIVDAHEHYLVEACRSSETKTAIAGGNVGKS
jgi:glycosyltransferase involved in cell wall biosynthesis